jgi:NADP-dependent 3-hydroxy acid dehydrogenase YdfG
MHTKATVMNQFLNQFGPCAVVTGASSGIGKAFARAYERSLQEIAAKERESNG